jgi:hypothetical protein
MHLALLLFVFLVGAARAETPLSPASCFPESRQDRLEAVDDSGDARFAVAGPVRLADLRFAESGLHRTEALARLRALVGAEVIVAASAARDRWGRLSVRLARSGAENRDLASELVADGLALVDPGFSVALCRADLLAVEAKARREGVGLWGEDRYKPVSVTDISRLLSHSGQFVLVEGRIRSIGERASRTYLNFGADWSSDVTVVLPRKAWLRLGERGFSATALRGRVVRVRGIVEDADGPALTVTAPEVIEVLDEGLRLRGR